MKTENVVAIEKLSSLRSRVARSRKVNDEEVIQTRKVAIPFTSGKLKMADRILIAEYEGAALEAFITVKMIETMILELVAE